MNYSPLLHTLHDEQDPIGQLGRGTHHSVLSAVQWVDKRKKLLPVPGVQKFAVIWDEDHDQRVIDVIERAYMRGIFAPILYIGERKANLTAVVDNEFYSLIQHDSVSYTMAWEDICADVHGDCWSFELMTVDNPALGIIAASQDKVVTYLRNISNLWNLGVNPYVHSPPKK
jgi:hypothetical protein